MHFYRISADALALFYCGAAAPLRAMFYVEKSQAKQVGSDGGNDSSGRSLLTGPVLIWSNEMEVWASAITIVGSFAIRSSLAVVLCGEDSEGAKS
jgi:hypothetical protein